MRSCVWLVLLLATSITKTMSVAVIGNLSSIFYRKCCPIGQVRHLLQIDDDIDRRYILSGAYVLEYG